MQSFRGRVATRQDVLGERGRSRNLEQENTMRVASQLEETRAQVISLREALLKAQSESMYCGLVKDDMQRLSDVQQYEINTLRSELDNYVRQHDLDRCKISLLESQLDAMRSSKDLHMCAPPAESETSSPRGSVADNNRNPMLRNRTSPRRDDAAASRTLALKHASFKKMRNDMELSLLHGGSHHVEDCLPPTAPEESEASTPPEMISDNEGTIDNHDPNTKSRFERGVVHHNESHSRGMTDGSVPRAPSESELSFADDS